MKRYLLASVATFAIVALPGIAILQSGVLTSSLGLERGSVTSWEERETQVASEVQRLAPPAADAGAPVPVAAPQSPLVQAQESFAADAAVSAPAMKLSDTIIPAPVMQPEGGDVFADFDESGVKSVAEAPVSTFSVDVDTASYAYVRRMLEDGILPPADAVRVEEMVNYFSYDYDAPRDPDAPFSTTVGIHPTPWNEGTLLMHVGIQGYTPPSEEIRPRNLVFLIDTSGSMNAPDKLPLLKRAFRLLLEQLGANDTVAIATYAGSAGVVLEPTAASEARTILEAIDHLAPGGGTAGAAGIELAYDLARDAQIEDGVNRVILATDGDFNVGIADPDDLVDLIASEREDGISLSVLGFGQGNLGDDTMQALAQNGNGNASYISDYREARKVLVEEIGGTLDTIAKDVKIQVEFNPAVVAEYRLIGYETRALAREDFNDDSVDAGDIGAGHTVTALYEITPLDSDARLIDPLRYGNAENAVTIDPDAEYAFLRLRYKLPDGDTSRLIETPVTPDLAYSDLEATPEDMRFATAVAAFGQKLRDSRFLRSMDWNAIAELARDSRGQDAQGYRAELIQLVETAATLAE